MLKQCCGSSQHFSHHSKLFGLEEFYNSEIAKQEARRKAAEGEIPVEQDQHPKRKLDEETKITAEPSTKFPKTNDSSVDQATAKTAIEA